MRVFAVLAAVMFLSITVLELSAHARAGGSRSSGSRGSRSYSKPAAPTNPGPSRQQAVPPPSTYQQPQGGSFLRSMAGGIAGGLIGGMLFRSLGMAGGGMGGGGGIGLFEIILLAGIGYLIYRYVKKKREENAGSQYVQGGYAAGNQGYEAIPSTGAPHQLDQPGFHQVDAGLGHVRQMDPYFDEEKFKDIVMDNFFKIQAGWMNRNMTPVANLLTDEMRSIFQDDIDRMLGDKQTNRLENIAVRNVELVEVWQEAGQDFITTQITANLLDYTTDDTTGAIMAGSKTDPVKFDEYWTFTRPVGNNPWKLSAINQM